MKKINVGVIGLGVGFKHLKNLITIKNVNKIFFYDFDKKKIKFLYNNISTKKLFEVTNEDEIFLNSNIDLVCICSYDNYHFSHVKKALKNNKHIFVEKPLCLKLKELNFIKKKVEQKKKIYLSSNFVLRENSFFKILKKKIENNYFGRIYLIEANYNYGRIEKIIKGWRGKIRNYSVTHGGGVHLIDLIIELTGKKLDSVISHGNNISTKVYGLKFSDCVSSIIKCLDGSTINLISNFGSITPHHHVLKIYGTKATSIYDLNNFLLINKKNKKKILRFNNIKNIKTKNLKIFVNKLISKKKKDKIFLKKEKNNLIKITEHCINIEKSIKLRNWRKL
tara:strand:+ start:1038 stop:2045 length:1008 start_codon:yes stop_codon:yes gene_type:complete